MTDAPPPAAGALHHRLRRMVGRETTGHRAATPLELLFDLTFVVAFGIASEQAAHLLAEGHVASALGAFGFAMFAIVWAWINFSWFASAFDTDDWFYRVTTMVQMVGVIVLALGLPEMFHAVDETGSIINGGMVAGYIVMRVALLTQWLRAARQDPAHRTASLTFAFFVATSQVGWTLLVVLGALPWFVFVPLLVVTVLLDVGGPVFAERRRGGGTPWHPHHIAERYGLLVIIAIGEVVLGTVTAVSAIVEEQSWSADAVIIVAAGTALGFGLWWVYFMLPSGTVLQWHRERGFVWGYGHILVYASTAGVGAGLHVYAYVLEGVGHISTQLAVATVAVPTLVFLVSVFALYAYLVQHLDPFHFWLFGGSTAFIVLGVLLSGWGFGFGIPTLLIVAAPVVVIVGYETIGHRHEAEALARQQRSRG